MHKVLIVDDDKSITQALSVRLNAAGFVTCSANDAEMASLSALRERPDLVILDIDMPPYSGLELHQCLWCAPRTRDIPVIYLSAHDSHAHRRQADEQGARAFVVKPYDPNELIRVVFTELNR